MLYGVENPKITEDVLFEFEMRKCKHCSSLWNKYDGYCTYEKDCAFRKHERCELYLAKKLRDAIEALGQEA